MKLVGRIYSFVMRAAYFVGIAVLVYAGIKWLFF